MATEIAPAAETQLPEFAGRMIEVFNSAGLALMISIGHRTGLFDTLATLDPSTSQEIADRAGLQERYVREWLGAMVTGRIVAYHAPSARYHLPAEHAAFLTRAAAPMNMATTAQWISVLGSVEDKIVERFARGGGVPYCCYGRFHEVMAEESQQTTLSGLLDNVLPLVPGLRERLEEGIDVLDIGCGRGRAMQLLAKHYPNSRFVGYDLGEDAIAVANLESAAAGLTNVRFEVHSVDSLGEYDCYDLITAFDAIHDQAKPAVVLSQIERALRADGIFLMQDIRASSYLEKNVDHPLGPFLYTISCMHCMTVSLAYGGDGLGTAWGEELAVRMLRDAGFRKVEVNQLPHDMLNSYYIARLA